jgi:C-terminal processing protease CtpA/Prc
MSDHAAALRSYFLIAGLLLAAACGGGGGGPTSPPVSPPPPPPASSGPTWTQGVFAPAGSFKDRCAVVRTGVDIEGNPFPDRAGSLLEELFWLRSWTNETYLWNTEVEDRNPATFSDRIAYFNVLKTTATTPSGKPKDDFHFSQSTESYLRDRNSTPRAGYGARLIAFSTTPPRDYRVLYTEPNSPASQTVLGVPNLSRGARILRVDNIDLVNANTQSEIDALNAGLFPVNASELHSFLVEDVGGGQRTIQMTSANLASKPVNRTAVLNTPAGPVGYILFNTFSPFSSEQEIANAINAMKAANVTDLVLDLRYNGGGLLAVASQLSYMIAGSTRTTGRVFEALRFNAAAGNRNPVTGQTNTPTPFYTTGLGFSLSNGSPLQSLNLPRVFVLTTARTCSASESVVNALRGIDVEVILIGGTTCGKPFGFYPQDNCGETYFTIQFQGVNNKGFGDYADGFTPNNSSAAFGVRAPGCAVGDDLTRELGDTGEALLAAALQYRATTTCPPPSTSKAIVASTEKLAPGATDAIIDLQPDPSIMANNRDMTMPR